MSESCRNTARGKQGEPGESSYVYASYASNTAGAGFSLTPDPALKYIQFVTLRQIPATLTISNFVANAWVKYIGDNGADGSNGANGAAGADGVDGGHGAISFEYVFKTATSATDPGVGNMRFDNANTAAVSNIYIADNIPAGVNISGVFAQFLSSTSAYKTRITVSKKGSNEDFAVLRSTSITDNGTWYTIPVSYVSASGSAPFADGDTVVFSFSVTGDKGDAGVDATEILHNNLTPASSSGSGGVLMTYTIPANTLDTDGDRLNIRAFVKNGNASVTLSDIEFVSVYLVQGANTWLLGDNLFASNGEATTFETFIDRKNSTTGHQASQVNGSTIPQSGPMTGTIDWTATMAVSIVAQESIVSSTTTFLTASQLYVAKISI